jgi:hypothetical protein
MITVSTDKIQEFIDMGRLSTKPNEMITIRDLLNAGIISSAGDGVKLLQKVRTGYFMDISV